VPWELLIVEQFDFPRELTDRFAVMERGTIVLAGDRSQLEAADVRQRLAF
jgi:urea transport system ATP-binding protein